ncbi:hypothetical protein TcCL_ESM08170 [Trypanosoma cruzi]|nr:hypothetical protein TcCL_ESM08170 [Trypanosoma cruzi]
MELRARNSVLILYNGRRDPANRLLEVMNCSFALPWIYMQEALQFAGAKRRQSSSRAPGFQERLLAGLCVGARRIAVISGCPGVASAQGDSCLFSGEIDGPSHPSRVPHLSSSAPPWLDPSGVRVERGSLG